MSTTVTCRNADWFNPATEATGPCPSMDKPVPMTLTYLDALTGETHTVDVVICGACNQQITDIA